MVPRPSGFHRRDLLRGAVGLAGGVLTRGLRVASAATPVATADNGPASSGPLIALSLAELCRRAPGGAGVADLGGLTRLAGWIYDKASGDVIVLGARAAAPSMHIDDLVVVLRHVLGPPSSPPIGCTIDPLPDAEDPWTIQKAEIFGIPVCRMGVRHVLQDWDLKWQSADLARPENVVPGVFQMERAAIHCDGNGSENDTRSVTHRFWFCPRMAAGPRYTVDDQGCLVDTPVDVKLMTEQEFLERGKRVGAGAPSEAAERFATAVTEAMRTGHYAPALVTDFRLIELCRLLVYRQTPLGVVDQLVEHYQIEPVAFDGYVGGVHRKEEGEILCDHRVVRTKSAKGIELRSQRQVRRYRLEYRGGVEANVTVQPTDLQPDQGVLSELRQRVFATRKPAELTWIVA